MADKYVRYENFVIKQKENKSIVVFKEYDNTIEALRTIAGELGFEYDPKWTTRQFGSKLVKEFGNEEGYVFSGNNGVQILASGSIDAYSWYENTKEGLRTIATKCGFKEDPKWNTQQFGAKLMDFLNK